MKIRYMLMAMILCFSTMVKAQDITITGSVTSSEDQSTLPGVNIVVKGTTIGTITDVDGKYSLDVSSTESFLVFSSVGFVTEEIMVGTQTVIDLVLRTDIAALEEIVVIGYGTVRKSDLTGSVSSVKGEQLTSVAAPNVSPTRLSLEKIKEIVIIGINSQNFPIHCAKTRRCIFKKCDWYNLGLHRCRKIRFEMKSNN